ncbi:SLC13 family permease [Alteromonas ponticola]|uniref:SLC13 family permease n=1 Tax=Alteromonas aquimaris TaxID=2998417 RepID=A0ABT3P689_9ALTE|nr:SLC13 family permease [Alteromonas aquimaris]MCW8108287.1 SLC13 family permease [Alteromonas aquimaris]
MSKSSIVVLALLISVAVGAVLYGAQQPTDIALTAGITLFVAILWITEALPIPATSLIPFAAFPLTGVLTHAEAASSLGSHVIILLMGAFMLSKALEKSHLHQRFAVYMLRLTGSGSALKLLLGFMLTTALLSMWISNTATVLMILPMALAIIEAMKSKRFGVMLILGVAYAASVGGVGTPIGTPPNIIFMSVYQETQGLEYSFIEWMKTGVPIVLLALPLMALWLSRGLSEVGNIDLPKPGAWSKAEKRVLMVFGSVALAWVLRPLWTKWLGLTTVSDSTIAIAGVVAMFVIHNGEGKKGRLLDWKTANDIPWGMLLLFAGGICIAKAFTASGLSVLMGEWLTGLSTLPLLFLILSICLFVTFLTEITSNTATATLLMPILAAAALAVNVDAKMLMIPAAISASCAFMLPVATAPNAIAFATEKFAIKTMAREGVVLNVIVAGVVTVVCYLTL